MITATTFSIMITLYVLSVAITLAHKAWIVDFSMSRYTRILRSSWGLSKALVALELASNVITIIHLLSIPVFFYLKKRRG